MLGLVAFPLLHLGCCFTGSLLPHLPQSNMLQRGSLFLLHALVCSFCLLGIRDWTEALYMLSMCSTTEFHPRPPRDFCKLNVIMLILCIKPLDHLALLLWKKPTFQGWHKRLCARLVSFLTFSSPIYHLPPVLTSHDMLHEVPLKF